MPLLRLLLMVTWAAWIWFEAIVVFGRTLMDHLRGWSRSRDAAAALLLLVVVSVAFAVSIALGRLGAGRLPGPAPVQLGTGLTLMWIGLALRARATLRRVGEGGWSTGGAMLAAAGFGVALGHWSSLVAVVVGWAAGLAASRAARAR